MELKPKRPIIKGPSDWFTGDVWMDALLQPGDHSTLNVAAVHFTPAHVPPGTRMKAVRRSM